MCPTFDSFICFVLFSIATDVLFDSEQDLYIFQTRVTSIQTILEMVVKTFKMNIKCLDDSQTGVKHNFEN